MANDVVKPATLETALEEDYGCKASRRALMRIAFESFVVDGRTYEQAAKSTGIPVQYLRLKGGKEGWGRLRVRFQEKKAQHQKDRDLAAAAKRECVAQLDGLERCRRRTSLIEQIVAQKTTALYAERVAVEVKGDNGEVKETIMAPAASPRQIKDLLELNTLLLQQYTEMSKVSEASVREKLQMLEASIRRLEASEGRYAAEVMAMAPDSTLEAPSGESSPELPAESTPLAEENPAPAGEAASQDPASAPGEMTLIPPEPPPEEDDSEPMATEADGDVEEEELADWADEPARG